MSPVETERKVHQRLLSEGRRAVKTVFGFKYGIAVILSINLIDGRFDIERLSRYVFNLLWEIPGEKPCSVDGEYT